MVFVVFPSIVNFNSIKVQLKLNAVKASKAALDVFQFHKGTIKTGTSRVREHV